jgi:putative serine/threonine protein kinase
LITIKKNLGVSTPISLNELERDEPRLTQLSYPRPDPSYALTILDSLRQLGVDGVCFDQTGKIVMVGKGFRNIVVACTRRGEIVAAKMRRIDYVDKDAAREAAMLRMANEVGVGPRLLGSHGPALLMELISGEDLTSWLLGLSENKREEALDVLSDLLKQCFMLDRAGIDHDELSDASKHVLRTERGAVILDFGSAKMTNRPSNLTSIINYLFHGPVRRVSLEILGMRKPPNELLRRYKSLLSWDAFVEVCSAVMAMRCRSERETHILK